MTSLPTGEKDGSGQDIYLLDEDGQDLLLLEVGLFLILGFIAHTAGNIFLILMYAGLVGYHIYNIVEKFTPTYGVFESLTPFIAAIVIYFNGAWGLMMFK